MEDMIKKHWLTFYLDMIYVHTADGMGLAMVMVVCLSSFLLCVLIRLAGS